MRDDGEGATSPELDARRPWEPMPCDPRDPLNPGGAGEVGPSPFLDTRDLELIAFPPPVPVLTELRLLDLTLDGGADGNPAVVESETDVAGLSGEAELGSW